MASVLRRKWATFRRDPKGSLARKMRSAPLTAYTALAKGASWMSGLPGLVANRPPGAIPPVWGDLWYLYRLVRRQRPGVILEFGSGCSTIVMASALRRNRSGVLYSLEADPYWHRVLLETTPSGLRDRLVISLCPLDEVSVHGVLAFRHRSVPDVVPDLLYLDGPALTPERQVAVDPLALEDRLRPGFTMVVDGRLDNVAFLQRHLRRSYSVRFSRLRGNTTFTLVG
jgi:Methyltransferase domain